MNWFRISIKIVPFPKWVALLLLLGVSSFADNTDSNSIQLTESKNIQLYWGLGDFLGLTGVAAGYRYKAIEFGLGEDVLIPIFLGYSKFYLTSNYYFDCSISNYLGEVAPSFGTGYEHYFGEYKIPGFFVGISAFYLDRINGKDYKWKLLPYPQLGLKIRF